jgi:hypothetical protein
MASFSLPPQLNACHLLKINQMKTLKGDFVGTFVCQKKTSKSLSLDPMLCFDHVLTPIFDTFVVHNFQTSIKENRVGSA